MFYLTKVVISWCLSWQVSKCCLLQDVRKLLSPCGPATSHSRSAYNLIFQGITLWGRLPSTWLKSISSAYAKLTHFPLRQTYKTVALQELCHPRQPQPAFYPGTFPKGMWSPVACALIPQITQLSFRSPRALQSLSSSRPEEMSPADCSSEGSQGTEHCFSYRHKPFLQRAPNRTCNGEG